MSTRFEPTTHTAVRRHDRASYDAELIHSILDEAAICHVGLVDQGRPVVIPMLHVRMGDDLILHGAHTTRSFRAMKGGDTVCVTATIMDGLVLARSAFHHSVNYRSVVVFGNPRPVTDPDVKRSALDALTDKVTPGRRPTLRPMTAKELRSTAVVAVPIEEASAKVRTGPPVDDEADYGLPIWAGVVPVRLAYGHPIPDPATSVDVPDHLRPA